MNQKFAFRRPIVNGCRGYRFKNNREFVELFFIENDSDTSTEIFSTIWDGVWLSDSLKFNLYSFLG